MSGKLAFLCEGANDVLVVKSIVRQLVPDHVITKVRQLGGVNRLLKEADRHARILNAKGYFVIAVYDEADDKDENLILKSESPGLIFVPARRKIEAWLLADDDAVKRASGLAFRGPFPTDRIEDPKAVLLHHFYRAVRERKRSYIFKERDFFKAILLNWDLERARRKNISLNVLYESINRKRRA